MYDVLVLRSIPQRYLDEAEREKQQYMKELRAYQQSEAYKMCTEKIQEKKIKKGGRVGGGQGLLWHSPSSPQRLATQSPTETTPHPPAPRVPGADPEGRSEEGRNRAQRGARGFGSLTCLSSCPAEDAGSGLMNTLLNGHKVRKELEAAGGV